MGGGAGCEEAFRQEPALFAKAGCSRMYFCAPCKYLRYLLNLLPLISLFGAQVPHTDLLIFSFPLLRTLIHSHDVPGHVRHQKTGHVLPQYLPLTGEDELLQVRRIQDPSLGCGRRRRGVEGSW